MTCYLVVCLNLQAALTADPAAAMKSGLAIAALLAESGGIWLDHDVMPGERAGRWFSSWGNPSGFFAFKPTVGTPMGSQISTVMIAASKTSNLAKRWFTEALSNPAETFGSAFAAAAASSAYVHLSFGIYI
jgi:hypothetical protein